MIISRILSTQLSRGFAAVLAFAATTSSAADIDFAHDMLPILKQRCSKCHTNGTYKAGLSMDTREALLDSGVLEVGDPEGGEFIRRITSHDPETRMPLKEDPLPDTEISLLRRWIGQGLPWQQGFSFQRASNESHLALRRPSLPDAIGRRMNPIDRIVDNYWKRLESQRPSQVADAVFLRRVYLDVIGILPTASESLRFESDASTDRRRRVVAELLSDNRRFTEHWLTFWNDLLRNDYQGTGYIDGGRKQISQWLYQSLLANKRYDAFVRELIDPTPESAGFIAGIKWRGRVNASQAPELQFAQNISQVFLGVNMKCGSCHDSFIDDWKLTDAYGLAAIVSDRPLEMHRCDKPTGQTAAARFLYPELGTIDAQLPAQERLRQLADLLTHPDNGRFARTIVNRVWHRLVGRGIVEPVDVMSNQPWSEDLLDFLAGHLVDNGYDLKKTIELIASSEVYQAETTSPFANNDAAEYVFRGPHVRRLTVEQFLDNIWRITGTGPDSAAIDFGDRGGEPIRASIVNSDPLMRSLGRPNREQVVTTRPDDLTTLQALDLINGQILTEIVTRGANHLMSKNSEPRADEIVHELFGEAVQRSPTENELATSRELIGAPVSVEGLADFLWALFMLPDFQLIR